MLLTAAIVLMTPVLYVATVQAADKAWQMISSQDVFDRMEVRIGGRSLFTAVRSADGAWSIQRTVPVARKFQQEAPASLPPAR